MATLDQITQQLQAAKHPKLPDGHPRISSDGKPHRYGPGKKYWYSIHEVIRDGQVIGYIGAYGQWVGDDNGAQSFEWEGDAISPEDMAATRARQEKAAQEAEYKRLHAAKLAANRARQQWQDAHDEGSSVYLDKKQITSEGVRFAADGTLLVPMFQYTDGIRLVGLQKITPDGAKRFNKGMEKKGASFLLGNIEQGDSLAMIAEGYATGRSIRMATDDKIPLSVCFDAGGILPAAVGLRASYPDLHLLICADDDWTIEQRLRQHLMADYGYEGEFEVGADAIEITAKSTCYMLHAEYKQINGGVPFIELAVWNDVMPQRTWCFENTGRKRAEEAAAKVGNASVVYPYFADRGERKLTDFNDLHCEEGLHVVKAQIESAMLAALAPRSEDVPVFPHLQAVETVDDPLLDQAADIVRKARRASASLIQRGLRIGYNRAARMLEALEKAGIVSSPAANGSRKVLGAVMPVGATSAGAAGEHWHPDDSENRVYTWQQRLRRTDKGAFKPDVDNVIDILANDQHWKGVFGFELFSQKTMKLVPPPFECGSLGEWTDDDDVLCTYWLGKTYSITPRRDVIVDAVRAVARRNSYHVVLDYLRGQHHDGTKRVDDWLVRYLGVADTPYARLVSYKWLLGAVGRVMQPGCKMDNVLILEGPQDAGKSRTLSTLFGQQWTTDANLNLADANTPIVMAGKWVIELAELDSLSKADSASAKRWITTQVDTFRPPYGRRAIDLPRQCVVAGTVNFDTYLKDESGNRRYWPVKVAAKIDIAGLRADRDQIWAEAFALYCEWERASKEAPDGLPAPWVVMPTEKHLFEIEQEARYEGDVYESMIAQFLIGKQRVTVEEIMSECLKLEVSKMTKPEQRRVGAAMKSLGWIRKRESKGARQWYYTLPDPVVENPAVSPDGIAQAETDDDAPL